MTSDKIFKTSIIIVTILGGLIVPHTDLIKKHYADNFDKTATELGYIKKEQPKTIKPGTYSIEGTTTRVYIGNTATKVEEKTVVEEEIKPKEPKIPTLEEISKVSNEVKSRALCFANLEYATEELVFLTSGYKLEGKIDSWYLSGVKIGINKSAICKMTPKVKAIRERQILAYKYYKNLKD